MRCIGAHMSISGGLEKAIERIQAVEGTALQIFSKNQRQWRTPGLLQEQIDSFQSAWREWGNFPVAIHDSYLINLATPKQDGAEKSVVAFADELCRAEMLGVPFLVTHPGTHLGAGENLGITNAARRIDEALILSETSRVMALLENTAGQGSSLGTTFSQLSRIIDLSGFSDRIGICLDTAHAYEAGYDWCSRQGYDAAMEELDKTVGFEKLCFMHVNDSKTELGSRVDRHAHIGEGHIGEKGFLRIMQDARLLSTPMVLETPKTDDLDDDRRNLQRLRILAGEYKE